MASFVAAMSRASTSGVRRAKAFLVPSGLVAMSVQALLADLVRNAIPDQGVDLDGVDIILLLERILDLPLVRLGVDDEDEGVVLLDLLHGTLGVQRVQEDLVLVDGGLFGDGLARVLGGARQLESLGTMEGRRLPDLADLVRVDL